jgi:DNA repair protein RecO (recombination protein O)
VAGYKTEGIVLGRKDVGEADRIITLFSKHHGKIRALAKGIRRLTSRKGGNLELFNHVRVFLEERKDFSLITEVELVDSFRVWRKDLKKVAVAYELCELVDRLTAEHQKHTEVYELLLQSFSGLATADQQNHQLLITNYELSLLESLGFWPRGRPHDNVNLEKYIENLIERELKSKKFLNRV